MVGALSEGIGRLLANISKFHFLVVKPPTRLPLTLTPLGGTGTGGDPGDLSGCVAEMILIATASALVLMPGAAEEGHGLPRRPPLPSFGNEKATEQ